MIDRESGSFPVFRVYNYYVFEEYNIFVRSVFLFHLVLAEPKQDARGPAGYFTPQIIWATKPF